MHTLSKREGQEFLRVLSTIEDEKIRYFFRMLGEAIGESSIHAAQVNDTSRVNTSPDHVAEIAKRLNIA